MKYLLACVVLALKSFFSSCYECSSLHPKRPKGKERCAKPVAGKRLAENIGTPMYLSLLLSHKSFAKGNVSGGTLRFRKRRKYFIWHSLKGFAVLKEIEIILSGVSLILYLHLLVAKILGSIFYCILDFLLDFQETVWVAFFISGRQWMNNHIT